MVAPQRRRQKLQQCRTSRGDDPAQVGGKKKVMETLAIPFLIGVIIGLIYGYETMPEADNE